MDESASGEPAAAQERHHAIAFTGRGSDYFGIWIVNLLLSIVTLGIYSAWAKVRRLEYFYGNTLLDGSPFAFHGSPIALLKGRIVGVIMLVAYSQSAKVSLTLWLAVVAMLVAIFPWLIWKSLRFRLANSSYRGIRFRFTGTLGGAYATFLPPLLAFVAFAGWGLATRAHLAANAPPSPALAVGAGVFLLLFLVLSPWVWFRVKRFQHGNARLGTLAFGFDGRVSGAYGIALAGLGMLIAMAVAGGIAAVLIIMLLTAGKVRAAGGSGQIAGAIAAVAVFYVAVLSVQPLVRTMAQNFVWNSTTLDGAAFASRMRWTRLWVISAGNLLATIVTLGLFWPFAVVRSLRYELTSVAWCGDPAAAVAGAADGATAAVGEEAADLLGFELAL